jgi:hypothetical protein
MQNGTKTSRLMIFPGPKPSRPKALKLAGVPPASNTRAFLWLFFMALVCSGKFMRPGFVAEYDFQDVKELIICK